ncbi:hypothetical protein GCM10010182_03080 [Actinomadura cremea]|nr:hypothetical protein GCM10010182_03080 [Actinomadura cremea]
MRVRDVARGPEGESDRASTRSGRARSAADPRPAARRAPSCAGLAPGGLYGTNSRPVPYSPLRNVGARGHNGGMCRSIKTLRPPFTEGATDEDVRAAALQYVRKISGFRAPAAHNAEAFDRAVEEIAASTARLLDTLEVRGARSA